jgi:hypothetical protein
MRRSGTTIIMNCIRSHPQIKGVECEPHDLWFAVSLYGFGKFHDLSWVRDRVDRFGGGAKFALNAGNEALRWHKLYKIYPNAKFIFVKRHEYQVWRSAEKCDKNKIGGVVSHTEHQLSHANLCEQFADFVKQNPSKATMVDYNKLVVDPDTEMQKTWNVLGVDKHSIAKMVKTRRG